MPRYRAGAVVFVTVALLVVGKFCMYKTGNVSIQVKTLGPATSRIRGLQPEAPEPCGALLVEVK